MGKAAGCVSACPVRRLLRYSLPHKVIVYRVPNRSQIGRAVPSHRLFKRLKSQLQKILGLDQSVFQIEFVQLSGPDPLLGPVSGCLLSLKRGHIGTVDDKGFFRLAFSFRYLMSGFHQLGEMLGSVTAAFHPGVDL